jgi:hypothetical protein
MATDMVVYKTVTVRGARRHRLTDIQCHQPSESRDVYQWRTPGQSVHEQCRSNLSRLPAQMEMKTVCSFCLAFALTAIAHGEPAPLQQPPLQRAALLERFFAADENPLLQYRALRRLTASTRGGRVSATMDVWTTLDPVHGFTFQVVSESGSPLIRRRVLLAALEAEQRSQTLSDREEAALTRPVTS